MLKLSGVCKSFGERILFENVGFSLSYGERLGVVGRNGSGKSTLFKLILGQETPDQGEIVFPRDYRCGYLAQHLDFKAENIVREASRSIANEDGSLDYKVKTILSGLGFSEADMMQPAAHFSGGYQIRVELARVLVSEPDLLLLDEPTNYLDIVSLRWLERFLSRWPRELMVISHDRDFMDKITTHTMLIQRRTVRKVKGGTGKLYEQVAQDDVVYEQTRENLQARREHMQLFIDRFRYKASKASLVQSKIKALERMGEMVELERESALDFKFRETAFPGKVMLEARSLKFDYEGRAEHPLIDGFSIAIGKVDRIGVIGRNGRGKSTLLNLLAREMAPQGGELVMSPNTCAGFFGQSNIQRLSPQLSVEQEIQQANIALSRTEIRNICGLMMFSGDDALKQTRVLSGGEKSRVLLGKLLARPANLLLLDEPSNHLDMESVGALTAALKRFAGAVVIVTHDEEMLRALCNRLVVFQGKGPEVFEGGYDYFLEKVGWEDEIDSPGAAGEAAGSPSPRAARREKALARQYRARFIAPLEREVQKIEKSICGLEEREKSVDLELVEASLAKDAQRIAALSKEKVSVRAAIDTGFDALSEAYQRLKKAEMEAGGS